MSSSPARGRSSPSRFRAASSIAFRRLWRASSFRAMAHNHASACLAVAPRKSARFSNAFANVSAVRSNARCGSRVWRAKYLRTDGDVYS